MTEISLEELIQERQFAGLLQTHSEVFFRLTNNLLAARGSGWNKKHYFQLISESDALEAFLDDYGARRNRTYAFLTELVASLRGFALTGYSLSHLEGRLESYGPSNWQPEDYRGALDSLGRCRRFLSESAGRIVEEARHEATRLGIEITPETFPDSNFLPVVTRRRLPRNVNQADLVDEKQKIAEVATKYIQTCDMLDAAGVRPIADADQRHEFLVRWCSEEQARVYEASVHNLQSTYDTHIQNTVLEAEDRRLPLLRGHVSAALHLLEAVTHLTHFIERHEDEIRSAEAKRRISQLVERSGVEEVVLNELLVWVDRHMRSGRDIAEALLPEYTNVTEVRVELPDGVSLHARPAALVVGVVNHYGTPVEMEMGGRRCNAASILELLVVVGSHPDERRMRFHGDERPLRDIALLFEHRLGEGGLDSLPPALGYLRTS